MTTQVIVGAGSIGQAIARRAGRVRQMRWEPWVRC